MMGTTFYIELTEPWVPREVIWLIKVLTEPQYDELTGEWSYEVEMVE